jgi:hypothetical protein
MTKKKFSMSSFTTLFKSFLQHFQVKGGTVEYSISFLHRYFITYTIEGNPKSKSHIFLHKVCRCCLHLEINQSRYYFPLCKAVNASFKHNTTYMQYPICNVLLFKTAIDVRVHYSMSNVQFSRRSVTRLPI